MLNLNSVWLQLTVNAKSPLWYYSHSFCTLRGEGGKPEVWLPVQTPSSIKETPAVCSFFSFFPTSQHGLAFSDISCVISTVLFWAFFWISWKPCKDQMRLSHPSKFYHFGKRWFNSWGTDAALCLFFFFFSFWILPFQDLGENNGRSNKIWGVSDCSQTKS